MDGATPRRPFTSRADLKSAERSVTPVMRPTADLAKLLETLSRKYVSASPIAAVFSRTHW